jgi:opacity protein-like surface antigen
MRKLLLLGLLIPTLSNAQQKWNVELFGGFSNYQGDLQEKRFTTNQAKGSFGIGLKYDLTDHFALRSHFTYAQVSAADSHNKNFSLQQRNLSFESKITEFNVLADYSFLSLQNSKFTPYVFAGVALFHFNPYTHDTLGNKIFLQPLSTEGQGLAQYPDRKEYKLTQFSIPFGGGLRWRVSQNVVVGYEIGLRRTFTDYLDDVSTTYVDQATLLAAKSPKAVEMAFRGGELKNGATYPGDGTVRGSSKFKDWYYVSGITVSIGLGNRDSYRGSGGNKGSMDCPKF